MNIVMKAALVAALASVAACGAAETNNSNRSSPAAQENTAATHSTTGTVTTVSAGDVTIAHEPVATLQWPAMTMAFAANDAAMLQGIKPGDRVSFAFRQSGNGATLTSITKQ